MPPKILNWLKKKLRQGTRFDRRKQNPDVRFRKTASSPAEFGMQKIFSSQKMNKPNPEKVRTARWAGVPTDFYRERRKEFGAEPKKKKPKSK
jgi:hypothetical protein